MLLLRFGSGFAGAVARRTGGGAAAVVRRSVGRRACVVASSDRALLEIGVKPDAGALVVLLDWVPCPSAICPVGRDQAAIPTMPHPMSAAAETAATR